MRAGLRSADLAWLWIGLLTAAVLCALSFNTPFVKDPEATYAIDVRSVLRGNWLLAQSLGRKPPLFAWLAALFSVPRGAVTEVTARMPGVMAGGMLAALLFAFTSAHLGRRAAIMTWLALTTMGGFVTNFVTVQVDPLLVLCIYAALIALYPIVVEGAWHRRDTIAAGVALGAGMLSKGPIGLMIVVLSIACWMLAMRRNWRRLPWRTLALVMVIASLIAVAWYVAGYSSGGLRFALAAYDENLGHFLPGTMGGTGEAARPFYFIAARLLGASVPIVAFAPAAVIAMRRESNRARREFLVYATMPLWVVLIVFSLASSKREVYILPAIPALAILVGNCLERILQRRLASRAALVVSNAALAVMLAAAMSMAVGVAVFSASAATQMMMLGASLKLHPTDRLIFDLVLDTARSGALYGFALSAAGAAALIASGMYGRRGWAEVAGVLWFAMLTTMLWAGGLRPALARVRTQKYFLSEVARRLPADEPVYVLKEPDIEAEFYLDRKLPILSGAVLKDQDRPIYVLMASTDTPPHPSGPLRVILASDQRAGRPSLTLARIDPPDTDSAAPPAAVGGSPQPGS